MAEAKLIVTEDGEHYAAIPLEEFRAFQRRLASLEDEVTELQAECVMERIRNGVEPLYPVDIMRRVFVNGEHPVKVLREWHGITQEELAEKVGTSKAYISQIETRHRKPGRKLLFRLAEALDVSPDLLLEE